MASAKTGKKKTTAPKKTASKQPVKKTTAAKTAKPATTKAAAPKAVKKVAAPKKTVKKTVKKAVSKKAAAPKKTVKKVTKKPVKTAIKRKAPARKAVTAAAAKKAPAPQKQPVQIMEATMAKGQVKIDKIAQDMTSAGKQQAEAYAACFGILFKGSEDIVKTNTAFIQKFAEKQAQYMNDSLQVKTLNEWAETQNEIAQANLNDLMDMATRTSEQCVKLAVDVMAPINQQIGETVKKAGKSMAA